MSMRNFRDNENFESPLKGEQQSGNDGFSISCDTRLDLSGKKILVGITGAIAAYKTLELIRMLKRANAEVRVVVTPNALEFVTKTTLQCLSQNAVYVNQYDIEEYKPEHISLADSSDLFVVAPASANTISKIANGICDNLLTSVLCAFKKPVVLAPAMNTGMWDNNFVQENLCKLKDNGVYVVEPEEGFLACGYNGKGRLANVSLIFDKIKEILIPNSNLSGKKVVITAGGTKEDIDPVRYIGNYSSGKMGIALADSAYMMGADVTLISTFDIEKAYNVVKSGSAQDMLEKVEEAFKTADTLIMAAAVSDYRVKNKAENKIKKLDGEVMTLKLVKNTDILEKMSKSKKENQIVVGFCAESENLIENAKEKIQRKQCDYLVANDISKKDIGFSSDYNEVYILDKNLKISKIEKDTKMNIAKKILEEIYG